MEFSFDASKDMDAALSSAYLKIATTTRQLQFLRKLIVVVLHLCRISMEITSYVFHKKANHCVPESCFHLNLQVQHVLTYGNVADREALVQQIKNNLLSFSQHKFASNVVEKCLTCATANQRQVIIKEQLQDRSRFYVFCCR